MDNIHARMIGVYARERTFIMKIFAGDEIVKNDPI